MLPLADTRTALQLVERIANAPCASEPRTVDRPIALYGAGNLGRLAKDHLSALGISCRFVVDREAPRVRQDPFWRGLSVMAPDEVPASERKDVLLAVCVATAPFAGLRADLASHGWTDVVPFYDVAEAYRTRHPLGNGWFAGPLDQADREGLKFVLAGWADDVSRSHHLQFAAWHCLRDDWYVAAAAPRNDDRYFIPEVRESLHDREVFVDGGAYHGHVSARFASMVEHRYSAIVAVEPDSAHRRRLCRTLAGLPQPPQSDRIRVHPCALGAQPGRRPFFAGLGYASQLCEFGNEAVDVETIDRLDLAPTFVKLHLEGGELDALKGAAGTLARCRPIVAVTTYHSRLGLWETPEWLMRHLTDYVFLLRLHSWCGTGAVVYGLPTERWRRGSESH